MAHGALSGLLGRGSSTSDGTPTSHTGDPGGTIHCASCLAANEDLIQVNVWDELIPKLTSMPQGRPGRVLIQSYYETLEENMEGNMGEHGEEMEGNIVFKHCVALRIGTCFLAQPRQFGEDPQAPLAPYYVPDLRMEEFNV